MDCHHTILFIMRRMKTSNQSKSSLHFAVCYIVFSFVLSWQVPYVWAFIVKFCKEAIKGLGVVDE